MEQQSNNTANNTANSIEKVESGSSILIKVAIGLGVFIAFLVIVTLLVS